MIWVNGKPLDVERFPDGTPRLNLDVTYYQGLNEIKWDYDSDDECFLIWCLNNHMREHLSKESILVLVMSYIPNARMDRVKDSREVFTLKWFAEFINSMKFDYVFVEDPHSNVSTALINNVRVADVKNTIEEVLDILTDEDVILCYPDEGSAKRYSDKLKREYVFCIKHRNWETGKIESLELTNPDTVKDRNVLIVDDICSRGGTFTYTAKALKEAGVNNIYLYVTHCENTIRDGSVLTDGLINHVYTTDSIFRGGHEKITVVNSVISKIGKE